MEPEEIHNHIVSAFKVDASYEQVRSIIYTEICLQEAELLYLQYEFNMD